MARRQLSKDVVSNMKGSQNTIKVPPAILEELNYLKSALVATKGLKSALHDRFSENVDVYNYVISLVQYAHAVHKNLSHKTLQCFEEWLSHNIPRQQLTIDVQIMAMHALLEQKVVAATKLGIKIFKLTEAPSVRMKDVINHHIKLGHDKQICWAISCLKLQHCYTFEELPLRLVLENKMHFVIEYFEGCPELQISFAKCLDYHSLSKNRIDALVRSLNIKVKYLKAANTKSFQKLLANFINSFKIPIDTCPNLFMNRSFGALNYLVHMRYVKECMSPEAFKEMSLVIVRGKLPLIKELLVKLISYNEVDVAFDVAEELCLDAKEWPSQLSFYAQNRTSRKPAPASQNRREWWRDYSSPYLLPTFNTSDIIFVNTIEKFEDCVESICENYDVVGVDAEWRPDVGLGLTSDKMSILQLAVWDFIYLLDIQTLSRCLNVSHWDMLMDKIFCNPEILKLGYAIKGDLEMLSKSCSATKQTTKQSNILDWGNFFKKMQTKYPAIQQKFESAVSDDLEANDSKGLSKLCHVILGKPLNKGEQFSDWERRPLRVAQQIYAALDAYCLLCIYSEVNRELKAMSLNLSSLINEFLKLNENDVKNSVLASPKLEFSSERKGKQEKSHTVTMPKTAEWEKPPVSSAKSSIPVSNFKVVVDTMLQGLGKQLQNCGVDVAILNNGDPHSRAAQIAVEQGRYVLSAGTAYYQICSEMPENLRHTCYDVPPNCINDQIEDVFSQFNVVCDNIASTNSTPKHHNHKNRDNICRPDNQDSSTFSEPYSYPPIPIASFRVVVDTMLQGLGRNLRMQGADAIVLANGECHMKAVQIAHDEHRYVLSSGNAYNQICSYLPPEICLNVPPLRVDDQVTYVCEYFNIHCTEDDVFTRCTLCNCDHYLIVSSEDMEVLWIMKKTTLLPSKNTTHNKTQLVPFIVCDGGFITEDCVMNTGVNVKIEAMPSHVFQQYSRFLICSNCGKVYWEGSHHQHKRQSVIDRLGRCSNTELSQNSTQDTPVPRKSMEENQVAGCSRFERDYRSASQSSIFSETGRANRPNNTNSRTYDFCHYDSSDEKEDDELEIVF